MTEHRYYTRADWQSHVDLGHTTKDYLAWVDEMEAQEAQRQAHERKEWENNK
jgi:hypothetical protein